MTLPCNIKHNSSVGIEAATPYTRANPHKTPERRVITMVCGSDRCWGPKLSVVGEPYGKVTTRRGRVSPSNSPGTTSNAGVKDVTNCGETSSA